MSMCDDDDGRGTREAHINMHDDAAQRPTPMEDGNQHKLPSDDTRSIDARPPRLSLDFLQTETAPLPAVATTTTPDGLDRHYDMTGASYEALFSDGGLFSDFINDESALGIGTHWAGAYDDEETDVHAGATATAAVDAGQPARLLPLREAVDTLMATCPRMISCKPATLALERAPLVHVIRRHMRAEGPVDFAPAAGGLVCESLAEACERIDGLGPVLMLERGVVAWLAGRLMERVRPGSSQGVPVGPMGRIGTYVQHAFGGGWTFCHPDELEARFDEPQHEPIRALLTWMVDSARTVARVRDGIMTPTEVPHRPPNGKDYTYGPLKRLASSREAYRRFDPHDAEAWAAFMTQSKATDRDAQQTPLRAGATRAQRSLARSMPVAPSSTAPMGVLSTAARVASAHRSPSLLGDVVPNVLASAGTLSPNAESTVPARPSGGLAPVPSVAPPQQQQQQPQQQPLHLSPAPSMPLVLPPPPPPPAHNLMPTTMDATALDRAVLAQVQSIALMTLSAADPAALASGSHIAFMAPSITCPGAMAFTCWVAFPPGADDASPAVLPLPPTCTTSVDGDRPRKKPRLAKKPRRGGTRKGAKQQQQQHKGIGQQDASGDASSSKMDISCATTAAPLTRPVTGDSLSASSTAPNNDCDATADMIGAAHSKTREMTDAPDRSCARIETVGENAAFCRGDAQDSTALTASEPLADACDEKGREKNESVHVMQVDVPAPVLLPSARLCDQNKPTETDFDRLFATSGTDEWEELLADGQVSGL